MDIYKRFGISSSFLDAIQSVTEKKALDPVDPKQAKGAFQNRKDKDIDNDGKVTGTDKYLHARRNAVTKAMSEKKKNGKKDVVDTEPKIDDKEGMRGVQEAERRADAKMVKVRNPDGTMSFRKERPEIKVEEVEELDELSKGTLASYAKKASRDARIKMATGKDFERHAITSRKPEYKQGAKDWEDKYKSDARRREAGVNKAIDRLAREEFEELDELSPETHRSYQRKARASLYKKVASKPEPGSPEAKASSIKGLKRMGSIERSKQKQISGIKVEEVEEIDEVSADVAKRVAQARDRSAVANKLTPTQLRRLKMGSKGGDPDMNAADALKKAMKRGAKDVYEEGVKSGLENPHNCATHVYSEQWGDGTPIKTMHAEPDEYGDIAWYDVMFDHGIEKQVPIEELKVVRSEAHIHSSKKPKNEASKVDELDKKTLDKYSTRARFSSNPKHREGALKAMDKIKNKSKNEK